ncbi:MAG: thiol protease/hemagglutinin PrtT [bacterium]
MKRTVLILVTVLLFFGYSQGKTVKEQSARVVAANYIASSSAFSLPGNTALLQLCYAPAEASATKSGAPPVPLYYVFNINGSGGFIIISGDDVVHPVLAYSTEGGFIPDEIPASVAAWLEGYADQISYAITSGIEATREIRTEWVSLSGSGGNPPARRPESQQGVNPLLTTKWNQDLPYNAHCPYLNYLLERPVTGCVATAMAMVMKYHNYPPSGIGSYSYNDSGYGTLAANFAMTTYGWNLMPDFVTSYNPAVAILMRQCGISVQMDYNLASAGGSTAYIITGKSPIIRCTEYALKNNFGYTSTLKGVQRAYYTTSAWQFLLKTELDAKRPVIYGGFGTGGGHCFVCDGYDDQGNFHFNWGWGGNYDGYFMIDALNPGGTGIGGGTGAYNSGHQAVIGVRPPFVKDAGNQFYKLVMNAPITSESDTVSYKDTLSFQTNIINKDPMVFNGDICAAVFDTNDIFIDYVQIIKGVSLQPGAQFPSGISFTNPRLSDMLPGTYYVGIMYSSGDTNWKGVADTNTFLSRKRIIIVNKNDIEMYSAMNITPGTTIPQGSAVNVQVDVKNRGLTDLHGTLALALYDIDGDFMNVIEEKTNFTLLSQEHTSGLTFSTPGLNEPPASYLLVLQYMPEGTAEWLLVGLSSYKNPVKIEVEAVPLTPDQYEPDNTPETAYALPVSFGTNPALIVTEGANCHTGVDYDFYKITLPAGYTYVMSCVLYDLWSDTSDIFTLEAIWSYSTDGTNWSEVFDDTIPANIVMENGGTAFFHVTPIYTGETGTYQLKITVARNPLGIGETGSPGGITIYPNPASERLNIKSSDREGYISGYRLSDSEGRDIENITLPGSVPECTLNTGQLNEGFYILRIMTVSGVINRKVIIRR